MISTAPATSSRPPAATGPAPVPVPQRRSLGVAVAVLATMGLWGSLVWTRFAYMHDDLILFTKARQDGLSRAFLGYNLFEHFSPLDHFFYWLELSIRPLDSTVGVVIVGVLLTVMLLSLDWVLVELAVEWRRRAAAIAFVGGSIVTLTTTTWWGQGAYIPPALTAMLVVIAAHLRGDRTGRLRWHAVAALAAVGGLLVSERTLFVVGFAAALDVLVVDGDRPWRSRPALVWRRRWSLGSLLAVCGAGAVFIRLKYYESVPPAHLRDIVGLIVAAWTKWFVPSLLGFYTQAGASRPLEIVIALATLGLAALLIRARAGNVGPLALVAIAFVVDYAFLGIGRLGIYPIAQEGGDIQYVAWVLPFVAIGACRIELPPSWWRAPTVRWLGRGLAAGLAGLLLVNLVRFAYDAPAMQQRVAVWNYWQALRGAQSQWDSPNAAVLPLRAPGYIAAFFVDPYGRAEIMLPMLDPHVRVGDVVAGAHLVLIDSNGNPQPAALQHAAVVTGPSLPVVASPDVTLTPRADATCMTATSPAGYVELAMPTEVTGSPLLVDITYDATQPMAIRFTTTSPAGFAINPLTSALDPQSHEGIFALEGKDVAHVQIDALPPGESLCLRSIAVVRPLMRTPDGMCRTVDLVGSISPIPVSCPGKPD